MTTSIWFWGTLVTGWALVVALGLLLLRGGAREPEPVDFPPLPYPEAPCVLPAFDVQAEANRLARAAWTGTPQ